MLLHLGFCSSMRYWRSKLEHSFAICLAVSLVFAGSESAQQLPSSMKDCSADPACRIHVDPSLVQLQTLLFSNSVHGVSACMDTLRSRERTGSLAQNGCVQLVTGAIVSATKSWLRSTELCTSGNDTGSCNDAEVSASLGTVQLDLTSAIRPTCELLLGSQGARALPQLAMFTQRVAWDILPQISQQLANDSNVFISDEVSQLDEAIRVRLNSVAGALVNAQAKELNSLITSFGELLATISGTLAQYSLPNRENFVNQTLFLVCSALYPTCMCSSSSSTSSRMVVPEDENTTGIPLSLTVLRPCYWSCVTSAELLNVAPSFIHNTSALRTSLTYNIIQGATRCAKIDEPRCLDLNCGADSTADTPAPTMQYLCDKDSDRTTGYVHARGQSQQACLVSGQRCVYPLQSTTVPDHYSPDVQAETETLQALISSIFPGQNTFLNGSVLPCAVTCGGMLFDPRKESHLRSTIIASATVTLLVEILTIISFFINRHKWNRCPTRLLLNISICFMVSCCAILLQVSVGWDRVTCHEDGTLIFDVPRNFEAASTWCLLTSIILFYGLLSALLWWLCLCHGWLWTFKVLHVPNQAAMFSNKFSKREIIYHVISWGGSFVLLVAFLSYQKIGGVPMFGICFTADPDAWFFFLIVPIVIIGPIGFPMMIRGLRTLQTTRKSMKVMDECRRGGDAQKNAENLRQYQAKVGLVVVVSFAHLVVQFAMGVYQFALAQSSKERFQDHISCNLLACEEQRHLCPPRPEYSAVPFAVLCVGIFSEGIVLCSWAVTAENWKAWVKFIHSPLKTLRDGATPRRQSALSLQNIKQSRSSESDGTPWENKVAGTPLRDRKHGHQNASRTTSAISTTTAGTSAGTSVSTVITNQSVDSDTRRDAAAEDIRSPGRADYILSTIYVNSVDDQPVPTEPATEQSSCNARDSVFD
eukprot:scpid60423/ scgid23038/ Smoothened homolog